MKKLTAILILLTSCSLVGYCQLLSNPILNVEDIEISLSNPDHLRKILHDHDFVYEPGESGNQSQPGAIKNLLVPNVVSIKTEYWRTGLNYKKTSAENVSDIIRIVSIDQWEPGKGPHPDAIKSVTIWINEDPVYADKVQVFLQRIKDRYPIKNQRYIGNSDLQHEYSDPISVFANSNSRIEVRMNRGQIDKNSFYYIVSFDLVR